MSNLRSINEPEHTSRSRMLTPMSINEPLALPDLDVPAPVIASIDPAEATIGEDSFTLYVTGENFYPGSVILFADQLEPTTLEDDGTLSTGINMDVWLGPDVLPVVVLNGEKSSNEVLFTFHPAGEVIGESQLAVDGEQGFVDPDELEEEIEQAGEEGDFRPLHRGRPTTTLSNKRSKAAKAKR